MRKNIIITALALMGAIAFTSCVREEFETPGEAQKDNTVNFTINTGSAEVKSYMEYDEEAGKYVPNWHKGDALAAYFVSADGAPTQAAFANTNENGPKASFSGSAALEAGNYDLYVVCPARSYQSVTETMVVGLEFPYIQFPTATSFDPKADVLVNVPYDVTVEGTDVTIDDMRFRRVGSIVKVVLSDKTGSLAGDNIRSVYLESDMKGAALSGVFNYDYKTEDAAGMTEPKNHVTADLTRLETPLALDGENAVYLVLPPCTLTADSKLTVNVKTDRHEVVKTITLAKDINFLSSEVITLSVGLDANCTVERVYFQDNFDWLYYWWDTIPSSDKDGIRDPIAAGTTSGQKQPNIWSKYADSVGADVTARGYVDLNQDPNVLYIQENFFKLGKTEHHDGLELPSVAFGTSPIDVELSFKYAVQDVKVDLVVEVLNVGKCLDTDKTRSLTLFSEDALIWKTARVILSGVTNETRIQIKPDLRSLSNDDSDVTDEKYRWFLDDIKITNAPERSESMFPVIWSFPTPGESWAQGVDYDIVANTGGSYIYSNDHSGKLSVFVPDNKENSNANKYVAGKDVTGSSQYVMTQYGIYKGSYWLFEIDDVINPAGTYNITYYSHSSASGPKYFLMEYSLDNGLTWTSINSTTGTFYYNDNPEDLSGPMEITYTYGLLSKKKNRICESFHLDAINAQTKLMIRSTVAEDYRASKNGSIDPGGSHRIGCNVVISFTPDAE